MWELPSIERWLLPGFAQSEDDRSTQARGVVVGTDCTVGECCGAARASSYTAGLGRSEAHDNGIRRVMEEWLLQMCMYVWMQGDLETGVVV